MVTDFMQKYCKDCPHFVEENAKQKIVVVDSVCDIGICDKVKQYWKECPAKPIFPNTKAVRINWGNKK